MLNQYQREMCAQRPRDRPSRFSIGQENGAERDDLRLRLLALDRRLARCDVRDSVGGGALALARREVHRSLDGIDRADHGARDARRMSDLHDAYRRLIRLTAFIEGLPDWQSPRHFADEKTFPNGFDYLRSASPLVPAVENRLDRSVAFAARIARRTYLLGSGMGAFTTVLAGLVLEVGGARDRPIIVGARSYIECLALFRRLVPRKRLLLLREDDTARIVRTISREHPQAVFLDATTSTPEMTVPDFRALFKFLKGYRRPIHVVIDTTLWSTRFQLRDFIRPPEFAPHLCVILFRSLNKFDQDGLDGASAGTLTIYGKSDVPWDKISGSLGVGPSAETLRFLPFLPRRERDAKLRRHARNATRLAEFLGSEGRGPIQRVGYPGLSSHPQHHLAAFPGALVFVSLRRRFFLAHLPASSKLRSLPSLLVMCLMDHAQRKGVPLHAGNSFGLRVSRLMVMFGTLRFAAGTERPSEFERVVRLFAEVFARFERPDSEFFDKLRVYRQLADLASPDFATLPPKEMVRRLAAAGDALRAWRDRSQPDFLLASRRLGYFTSQVRAHFSRIALNHRPSDSRHSSDRGVRTRQRR
jgi:hypothetical protein